MDMRCFSFNWAHCRLMLFLRDCFRRLLNRSNKLSAQRLFSPHSLYSADYRFGLWVGTSFPSHVRIIACSSAYFHSLFFSLVLCLYRDNCLFWVFATRNCRAIIWYSACVCAYIPSLTLADFAPAKKCFFLISGHHNSLVLCVPRFSQLFVQEFRNACRLPSLGKSIWQAKGNACTSVLPLSSFFALFCHRIYRLNSRIRHFLCALMLTS